MTKNKQKYPLSVVIPTLNEESHLEECLLSIDFAEDVIVIDSFSSDRTEEIAKKYNVNFLERKFDNFSSQKNYALQFAKYDWVLFFDADERITEDLKSEILAVLKTKSNNIVAYELLFRHFFINRFLRFSGQDYVLRLINKKYCKYGDELVHEKIKVKGKTAKLKSFVPHYTYKSLEYYLEKREKYANYQAQERIKKGQTVNFLHMVAKPWWRFFNDFVLRFGYLDGFPSYAIKKANAYGVFLRALKMIVLKYHDSTVAEYYKDYNIFFEELRQQSYKKALSLNSKNIKPSFLNFFIYPKLVFFYSFYTSNLPLKNWLRYSAAWHESYAYILTYTYLWMFNRGIKK